MLSKGRMLHSEFKDVASIQIMLSLVGQNLNKSNWILLLMQWKAIGEYIS